MLNSLIYLIEELFDIIEEIWISLKHNKTRNILTGFGVAWGIFILIVLLGAGEGLQTGVMKLFGNYAQNSLWFFGGTSSIAQSGNIDGKKIYFTDDIISDLKIIFPNIDLISPEKKTGIVLASNSNRTTRSIIYGVLPDYFAIKVLNVSKGRSLNNFDQVQMRKVAVIGSKLVEELFSDKQNVLGNYIEVNGTWIKIVGIIESGSIFTQQYESSIIITIPIFKETMNDKANFDTFGLTLNSNVDNKIYKNKIQAYLARRLGFGLNDTKALYISDLDEQTKSFKNLFVGIKLFLWFIGFSLLSSGIIGISNIMYVSVKERTQEIGIRKAIGATYKNIMLLIITESIIITSIAGSIGMLIGIVIIQIINTILYSTADAKNTLINSLNINFNIALLSFITVIFAGVIAGIFPARKAANINPISAINHDAN